MSGLPGASFLVRCAAALVMLSCGTETQVIPQVAIDEAGSNRDALAGSHGEAGEIDALTYDESDGGSLPEDATSTEVGSSCERCPQYGTPTALGAIPAKLVELSGLAASHSHPGILYAHNDSGDIARFFAINDSAQISAEMDLTGATAIDWEDIAVGPCPAGSCVYLGDIGDNSMNRAGYTIYRVAEPDVLATDGSASSVAFERFPFVYPDGKHNAETLLVHPLSGRIFVVTKVAGVPAGVYELPAPLTAGVQATLQRVMAVSIAPSAGVLTGGSFHPCGDRLLLRTYGALYELTDTRDGGVESIFGAPPVMVPAAAEVQGEAVTYSLDGKSYFTSSETVGALTAQLTRVGCP